VPASYLRIAQIFDLLVKKIASHEDSCEQKKNSVEAFLKPIQSKVPELWIIKWTYKGKTCVNHTITGKIDLDTIKKWVKVIGDETGDGKDYLEITNWMEE